MVADPSSDPFAAVDIDRLRARGTAKWSQHGPDVLPAWIAEMDLELCPAVRAAVDEVLDAGATGYPAQEQLDELGGAFSDRYDQLFGWRPDPEGARPVTDLVGALRSVLTHCTGPGDGVVLQTPVYPKFLSLVREMGRTVVEHPAELVDGRWVHDASRLDALITDRTRVIVVVNPHNPLGTVATRKELLAVGDVARRHDLVVVADEVHSDFVFVGEHVPLASVSDDLAGRTVTLNSGVKSFNLAGFRTAVAHCGSDDLWAAFDGDGQHLALSVSNFGVAATLGAWRDGDGWLDTVVATLAERREMVTTFLSDELPEVGHVPGDATYLAWLDLRALDLGPDPVEFFEQNALVALGRGSDYGPAGDGFVRLNFATSVPVLSEILERMVTAIDLRVG